jgi:hypothetical protein
VNTRRGTHNGRIGAWRLFDIFAASLSWRGTFIGGGLVMPRRGASDPPQTAVDPPEELPDSYLSDSEQQQAVQQERARRFVQERQRAHTQART